MSKIKSIEIRFMSGITIDEALSELKATASKHNAIVSGTFNDKTIHSDMTIDEACKLVAGKTKKELDAHFKKYQAQNQI